MGEQGRQPEVAEAGAEFVEDLVASAGQSEMRQEDRRSAPSLSDRRGRRPAGPETRGVPGPPSRRRPRASPGRSSDRPSPELPRPSTDWKRSTSSFRPSLERRSVSCSWSSASPRPASESSFLSGSAAADEGAAAAHEVQQPAPLHRPQRVGREVPEHRSGREAIVAGSAQPRGVQAQLRQEPVETLRAAGPRGVGRVGRVPGAVGVGLARPVKVGEGRDRRESERAPAESLHARPAVRAT